MWPALVRGGGPGGMSRWAAAGRVARSGDIGAHRMPVVYRRMNAIFSGVAYCAAAGRGRGSLAGGCLAGVFGQPPDMRVDEIICV